MTGRGGGRARRPPVRGGGAASPPGPPGPEPAAGLPAQNAGAPGVGVVGAASAACRSSSR